MTCKQDEGTTHYKGCDCHEKQWKKKLNLQREVIERLMDSLSKIECEHGYAFACNREAGYVLSFAKQKLGL